MAKKRVSAATGSTAGQPKAETKPRSTGRSKSKAKTNTNTKPESVVRVRMYCQGLGDCFLLTFPSESGTKPVRVLIDCGVFLRSPGEKTKLRQVAEDLRRETDGEIDLLVITHEHWDHISGFSHANDIFEHFQFKNVWLSWAEDADDPVAQAVKSELAKNRAKVTQALAKARLQIEGRLKADANDPHAAKLQDGLNGAHGILGFFGPEAETNGDAAARLPLAGGDADTNARASAPAPASAGKKSKDLGETMDWLRAKVRPGDYCVPGQCRPLPGAGGVKVYILGPPRSASALRKEDPSKGQGYELQADRVSLLPALEWLDSDRPGAPPGPFDARHRLSPEDARIDPFFREIYGFADDPLGDVGASWRRIDDEWLGGLNRLALQLDTGVNNTSLALAFELTDGRTLIFPGDAQIGNWLSWKDVKFKSQDGKELDVTTQHLLNRAVLYKVGHHGSHNATLKPGGLEAMTRDDLVAMIPTDQAYANTKSPPHGWKMPAAKLNQALMVSTHRRILRADVDQAQLDAEAKDIDSTPRWTLFRARVEFATTKFDPDPKDFGPPRPLFVEFQIVV